MLLNNITGSVNHNVYTYEGRTTVYRLIRLEKALRREHEGGLFWLNAAVRGFTVILCEDDFLPQSCSHLLTESVNDMEKDMVKQRVDVANLTVADLGMFASSEKNMKLLTMHRAKGREFDGVAIVDLHDGRVPHFSATTNEEIDEARRLLYVAITRARRILMYITDDEDSRIPPSPFLLSSELGLIPIEHGF